MRKVRNQTRSDWIGYDRHDDWNCGRSALHSQRSGGGFDNDDIDFALDQIIHQVGHTGEITFGRSPLDHYIPTLRVASLYHPLSKFLAQRAIRRSTNEYHTDLPLWSRLLRMSNDRK